MSNPKAIKLSSDKVKKTAPWFMAAAKAHHRASEACDDKSNIAEVPDIYKLLYFPIVAFELMLLAVELSLKLFIILHCSEFVRNLHHDPYSLYRHLKKKYPEDYGIRSQILNKLNEYMSSVNIQTVSENDIVCCLQKHRKSYGIMRYFRVTPRGDLNETIGFTTKDRRIMRYLSAALIDLNSEYFGRLGIFDFESLPISRINLRDMNDEQKAIHDKLTRG